MDRKRLRIAVPLLLPLSSGGARSHCKSTSAAAPKEAAQQGFFSHALNTHVWKFRACIQEHLQTAETPLSSSGWMCHKEQCPIRKDDILVVSRLYALPSSNFNADVPLLLSFYHWFPHARKNTFLKSALVDASWVDETR